MSGLLIGPDYNGWVATGSVPAAPTAMININAPLALGDASGGSTAKITVAMSVGLTGAYLTDGTTNYPLTGISAPDGTHLQGTVPAIPASSTLLSLVVQNASGDSPPLANAWESFWPTNFTITRILYWLRADKGVTGTTWTDQAHGIVFTATTVATDNAGINGKARLVFTSPSTNNTLRGTVSPAGPTKAQGFAIGKCTADSSAIWNTNGASFAAVFSFGHQIYENFGSNSRYDAIATLTLPKTFAYEVKADNAGNWQALLGGSAISTKTGNTVAMGTAHTIGDDGASFPLTGELEEVLLLNNDNLTAGEKARYAAYIADRYGLAA